MIKPEQIRMARGALKWGVRELAEKTGLTANTISRVENGAESMASTLEKIRDALEAVGIEFIAENGGGAGVRLRGRQK
jgi:transcriptional regulator with XRE-family HTH domain